jgi:hypothetical protein
MQLTKYKIHLHVEQRTKEWLALRAGKVTGSEVYNYINFTTEKDIKEMQKKTTFFDSLTNLQTGVIPKKPNKYKLASKTVLDRLCLRLCEERRIGKPLSVHLPKVQTKDMAKGSYYEDFAKDWYVNTKQNEYAGYRDVAFVENNDGTMGCSPDYVDYGFHSRGGKIISGVEMKCPQSENSYLDMLQCENADMLRQTKFDWYCQTQFNMYICELNKWDFLSYMPQGELINVLFEVPKDDDMFEIFDMLHDYIKQNAVQDKHIELCNRQNKY